ncbi:MAG: hypothetical protein H0T56_10650 [Pseudaminobacter sp.]|nr:hypothetical protein [Pseudaminobacter sp.]
MSHTKTLRLFGLAVLALLLAAPAHAAEMSVFMKNAHARAVVVELRSQTRATVWPGDDQVYLLESGEKKSVPVVCEAGETICYAAWAYGDDRIFWGVGPDNSRRCDDCCFTCTAKGTGTIDLAP